MGLEVLFCRLDVVLPSEWVEGGAIFNDRSEPILGSSNGKFEGGIEASDDPAALRKCVGFAIEP